MKLAEIATMSLAVVAFAFNSAWGSYLLLFVLATHSALFGPSKYGIIPEVVPAQSVSRANGIITSFTYLGIIIGTFLASFITEFTHRNFIFAALFCLFIAVAGFLSTLGIKHTPAQGSSKKFNPYFVREIFQTLVFAKQRKHLLTAIFGSSFFLFVGAFAQLNIIPFTLQSLEMSDVAGGYLFLATALGIAMGALLAGKASRKRIELGISCIAGFFIAIFLVLISVFSTQLIPVCIFLMLLGVSGGIFIVPFDSYIQLNSTDEKRGQVIGATNFLSFFGVLLASAALYLFSEFFKLTSAEGFVIIGIFTFIISIIFTARLSDFALAYFARKILRLFYRIKVIDHHLTEKASMLILHNASWAKALLLLSIQTNLQIIIPGKSKKAWLAKLFYSIHTIPDSHSLIEKGQALTKEGEIPCFFFRHPHQLPHHANQVFVDIDIPSTKHVTAITFSK